MRIPATFRRGVVVAGFAAALLAAWGCGASPYKGVMPANQRPSMELTQAPASTTQPYFYSYEFRWAGYDPDGVVDHYLYCVDPPTRTAVDTPWVSTTANRQTFQFRSETVDSLTALTGHSYHTVVFKAVDNGGMVSAPVARSFNSFTVAPTVVIRNPFPDHRNTPVFGPSFRLSWTGTDPDGRSHLKPVKYKYKVFPEDGLDFDFTTLAINPDSMRRYYAPGFSKWDSLGGDTTSVNLTGLRANQRYIFVVLAFDEAGAYSPVLNFDQNMLYFVVSYVGTLGPTLTVYNESFNYQFAGGSFSLDPQTWIRADLAADQPITFNWSAKTGSASFVQGFRWRLDGDIGDETPRTDEVTDVHHWSQWSPGTTTCTIPPISPPPGVFVSPHFMYIEARDNEDQTSLAIVAFNAIRPTFDKDLLIVNDTRLAPDKLVSGVIDRPRGLWPTAAELDTFFYAVGGVPWRAYPAGTTSPPGVFAGYDYDTLSTRFQPGGIFSLGQLGHYKHIIWFVDQNSARYTNPVDFGRDPMPALHAYSFPGFSNPVATWVKQGGRLWMFGGGAAYCMQHEFEKPNSNPSVFAAADSELVGGRFLFDIAHWQSEVTIGVSAQGQKPATPPGAWPGHPDYSKLPDILFQKYPDTDPIAVYAPNRTNQSDYFQSSYAVEGISKPNVIVEDIDPAPGVVKPQSVLDTLYVSAGGIIGLGKPTMTYYHGTRHAPVVYSGFPLWYFQRAQQIQIVDFVMQDLWGKPRRNVPR